MDFFNMLLSMDPRMWQQVAQAFSQPINVPQFTGQQPGTVTQPQQQPQQPAQPQTPEQQAIAAQEAMAAQQRQIAAAMKSGQPMPAATGGAPFPWQQRFAADAAAGRIDPAILSSGPTATQPAAPAKTPQELENDRLKEAANFNWGSFAV